MSSVKSDRIKVGDTAPDFSLPNQGGEIVYLKNFRGKKNVVLFFYPKDNSPGCSKEAAAFRNMHSIFADLDTVVIGISSDSIESHCNFAGSLDLSYFLLSDANGEARKLYGVRPTLGLIPGRVTYVIDKQGIVRAVISSQLNPRKHAEESLRIANALAE
jgi:peroxiredoxin Q/BCP